MSFLRIFYYVLWIAPVPVFVCLAALMRRRKLGKEFPCFFAFTVFQIVDFAVGFYISHRSYQQYFYAYWAMSAVSIGLGFGVLYEVFTGIFRPFGDLRALGAVLFRWAALVLLLAAAMLATTSRPAAQTHLFATILNLMRSVEVMQCGLVLLMLLCSSYLGVTLRHRIFGIALGFGVTAAVDLVAVTVLANLGLQAQIFFQLSKMLAYNISALLWMGYVYAGQVECTPAKQNSYAERWDYALAAALHPGNASPSLPLIEDAVERVWKQTNGHSKHPDNPPPSKDQ
ncbi:MAG: hypothetical protein LAO06_09345 [Acidobacteriia bacterium]|nr:hypothetical protein [Terriglobia bacterium]